MSGRQSPQAGEQKPLPPIVVKKYANRRLYNTETSSYVTLDDLAGMVRDGRDFVVYDAKSGEDLTRSVLTQIIVFPLFGLHASLSENLLIGCVFVGVSLVRSFTIRRFFNGALIKRFMAEKAS